MRKGTIRRSAAVLAATSALAVSAVSAAQQSYANSSLELIWGSMTNDCRQRHNMWNDQRFHA
jgi:Spy/CpxP family protein refolding chaperone